MKGALSLNRMVLAGVGLAFLLLNLCTWYYSDDYAYAFRLLADGTMDFSHRVCGVVDVLVSQYHHYMLVHGRAIATGLNQWFLSLDNRGVFAVCNAAVFMGYVYLAQRLSGRRGWGYTLLITALLFVCTRQFGDVFLWQSACVNYLWGGFFNLLFLLLLSCKKSRSFLWLLPLGLLAVVVGWMQECFSVGMSAALLILGVWRCIRKAPVDVMGTTMIVGYVTGSLLLILAPGTLLRMSRNEIDVHCLSTHFLANALYVLTGLRIFWLYLLVTVFRVTRHQTTWHQLFLTDQLLWCAMLGGIVFLMFLGPVAEPRAFFGVETMALVLLLRQLPSMPVGASVVALCTFIAIYIPVAYVSWRNHTVTQAFFRELSQSPDGVVYFHVPHYSSFERHYLGSRLVFDEHSELFFRESAFYNKPQIKVIDNER